MFPLLPTGAACKLNVLCARALNPMSANAAFLPDRRCLTRRHRYLALFCVFSRIERFYTEEPHDDDKVQRHEEQPKQRRRHRATDDPRADGVLAARSGAL